MTRILTHWVSPVQGTAPQTAAECIERAKAATPPGWQPRVLLPTLYGPWWQADSELTNTCGMEIRPKDVADLQWVYDLFEGSGVLVGGWAVPRFLTEDEGRLHGQAASVSPLFILDLEPYDGFLQVPDKSPADYCRGFTEACQVRPWVSIVPQPSGLDPLGAAWSMWAKFAAGLRPQCYGGDAPQLLYPQPSMGVLQAYIRAARVKRIVRPILDHATLPDRLRWARADRDVWVLA